MSDSSIKLSHLASALNAFMAGSDSDALLDMAGTVTETDLNSWGLLSINSANIGHVFARLVLDIETNVSSTLEALIDFETVTQSQREAMLTALLYSMGSEMVSTAHDMIAEGAMNSSAPDDLVVYQKAGILTVNSSNVGTIAAALNNHPSKADSLSGLQTMVDALNRIMNYRQAGSSVAPTAADFANAGIEIGLASSNAARLSMLQSVIRAQAADSGLSFSKLQQWADISNAIVDRLENASSSTPLSAQDLRDVGLSIVTDNNVSAAIDTFKGKSNLTDLQGVKNHVEWITSDALYGIGSYADGINAAPDLNTYNNTGVSGVNAQNLAQLNQLLGTSKITSLNVATLSDLQALVDSLTKVIKLTNGSATTASDALNAQDYLRLGAVIGNAQYDPENLRLLNESVDRLDLGGANAGTLVAQIGSLAATINDIQRLAAGGRAKTALTVEDLTKVGLEGVSTDNRDLILGAVVRKAASGKDTDTLSELNAMVGAAHRVQSGTATVQDFTTVGVSLSRVFGTTDLNSAAAQNKLSLLNSVIAHKVANAQVAQVKTAGLIEQLGDVVEQVQSMAAGQMEVTKDLLDQLGLTGVDEINELPGLMYVISNAPDDGSQTNSLAHLQSKLAQVRQSLASIKEAAIQNDASSLTVETFEVAGVSGVTALNLAAIKSLLVSEALGGQQVDSMAEIGALVDGYNRIYDYASGNALTPPQAADYAAIGVHGLSAGKLNLLNSLVQSKGAEGVASASQIYTLATLSSNIQDTAAGLNTTLNLADLANAGFDVSGDASTSFSALVQFLKSQNDLGSDTDSVAKVQAIISAVDVTPPTITGMAFSDSTGSVNGWYNAGDTVSVTVTLSEAVSLEPTTANPNIQPKLQLNVGGTLVDATFAGGNAPHPTELTFTYTVTALQSDSNGIGIDAGSLILGDYQIVDSKGNPLDASHLGLAQNSLYRVDAKAPTVAISSSASGTSQDPVTFTLAFDDAVTLAEGAVTLSGPGSVTSALTPTTGLNPQFSYYTLTVTPDPLIVGELTLSVDASKVIDKAGNTLELTAEKTGTLTQAVNTKAPAAVESMVIYSDAAHPSGYLLAGDAIHVNVTFTEALASVDMNGHVFLNIGGERKQAVYAGLIGTQSAQFTYVLEADLYDSNGVTIENNALVGGITDIYGRTANLNAPGVTSSTLLVDTVVPVITEVAIGDASGGTEGWYNAGDTIDWVVMLSEKVTMALNAGGDASTVPTLSINVGGTQVNAVYSSTDNSDPESTRLVFSYTVANGQLDTNGIHIDTGTLNLGDYTVRDEAGNALEPSHTGMGSNLLYKVDAQAPKVTITSSASGISEDPVTFTVAFDDVVTLGDNAISVSGAGTITSPLTLTTGPNPDHTYYTLTVTPESLVAGDLVLSVDANQVTDRAGNTLAVSAQQPGTFTQAISTKAPAAVESMTIDSDAVRASGYLLQGDTVTVKVVFTEGLSSVEPGTFVSLNIDGDLRQAVYAGMDPSDPNQKTALFSYTIETGLSDIDGITIDMSALSGNITDVYGKTAVNEYDTGVPTSTLRVDSIAPLISSVAFSDSTGGLNGWHNAGDTVNITVTLNEKVTVMANEGGDLNNKPTLKVNVGGTQVDAIYTSTDDSNPAFTRMTFSYTVGALQTDNNGVAINPGSLTLGDYSIRDVAGNAILNTHNGASENILYKIDTKAPTVTITPSASQTTGQAVTFTLAFDEVVTLGANAILVSGPGTVTSALAPTTGPKSNYSYYTLTVTPTTDAMGDVVVSVDASQVTDKAGNTPLSSSTYALPVNTMTPASVESMTLQGSTSHPTGYLLQGDTVSVKVQFSEAIASVSAGTVVYLNIGGDSKAATYVGLDPNDATQSTAVFSYQLEADLYDADGISIDEQALVGVITDIHGKTADNSYLDGAASTIRVDTYAPVFDSTDWTFTYPMWGSDPLVDVNATVYQIASGTQGAADQGVSYSISGTDADSFYIDNFGTVFFVTPPDTDAPSSYTFDLTATNDTTGAYNTQTVQVTVSAPYANVIDLGSRGQLIAPLQAADGQLLYHWDLNKNGVADAGDMNTHDNLDYLFWFDQGGVPNENYENPETSDLVRFEYFVSGLLEAGLLRQSDLQDLQALPTGWANAAYWAATQGATSGEHMAYDFTTGTSTSTADSALHYFAVSVRYLI